MAAASIVVLFLSSAFGLVLGFFIFATIYRLAVRIVAHFTPGYGNILVTVIVCAIAAFGVAFGLRMAGVITPETANAFPLSLLISYIIGILIFGVMIKNRNGQSLGLFHAFLANIVARLITVALACLIIAGFMGVYGYHPVLDAMNVYFHKAEDAYMKAQAAAALAASRANASPTPSNVPSVDQLLQQPLPGSAHYYLKTPITVTVAYGQMTYPSNTEVRLISQTGDQCQIQIANNTFTVSRSQLTTALQ